MQSFQKLILVAGILSLNLFAGNLVFADGEKLLLDSFEGKIDKQTADFGAAQGSSLNAEASIEQKACGNQSIKVTYDLQPSGYLFCARGIGLDVQGAAWEGPAPDQIDFSQYAGVSFSMFGNNSSGQVAFDVKDNGGEIWRYLVEDNFSGWKEIVVPFAQFKAREDWQPATAAANLKLDFPIKSYQWEPKKQGSGVYYFDCVSLVK